MNRSSEAPEDASGVRLVLAQHVGLAPAAAAWAEQLGLATQLASEVLPPAPYLLLGDEGLELRAVAGRLRIDFLQGPLAFRDRQGIGRKEPFGRALGLHRRSGPTTLLDATLGLGRDAFIAARLGCQVTAVERQPVVAALVQDALERALTTEPALAEVRERIQIRVADARALISRLTDGERPDVIYIDPMFPARRKTALVKQPMRVLAELAGDGQDAGELLLCARAAARHRVVVKRPAGAPQLAPGPAPDHTVDGGRSTRYDVYLPESVGDT